MLSKVKEDFENGIKKVKWFSELLSDRVRIEIAIFKLLYKSEELRKKKYELLRQIGEEVYEMRGKDKNVYDIKEVMAAIKAIESLEPEIKETMEKVADINKLVA
jgi:seryl-tRNA synthetase